ncbi:MAG: HAMP domain-containing protein [Alphaproteobacteria bacterium]|nr:MAG: HAMP domain-containing protein [Alphaproteobacteria bacterium]
MVFAWLKQYMPRSLYGRAALILIMPIAVTQIVVSVVLIQRYYEGTTRQMAHGLSLEVRLLLDRVNAAPDRDAAMGVAEGLAAPLQIELFLPEGSVPATDRRVFYDLSGRALIEALRDMLPTVRAIDLASDERRVTLVLDTRHGPLGVRFSRNRVTASNPHQLLVWLVFTGILMTLIAFLFLRNQLRPIRRLAKAAEAFGRGRTVPYAPSGAVEVRAAGHAFLDMRARIERHIEQRTLLLSGVSHDLRTPLTRLKLGLSLLDDSPDVEALRRDVEEMERILDAFLAFARDTVQEEPTRVSPRALVEGVAEDARRAGWPVELALPPAAGDEMVLLRPVAIRRALDNLVRNAAAHGTRIRLGVDVLPGAVRFRVEDDGPGIPPDRRAEALRPFARLDEARNQNRGSGVGLGLAIAADIARSHGGVLRLGESEELGGLKAEIVIPR